MVKDAPRYSDPRFPTTEPTRPTSGCLPNPSHAPGFLFAPASTPDNNNIFGISSFPASTPDNNSVFGISSFPGTKIIPATKPGTGSRLDPYSPTREPVISCIEKFHSISAMPAYMTKSHEELRWEDHGLLPNNKCCGSKNCDTLRSQIDTLHSQFETLRSQFQTLCSQFETFKPNKNLFGPKNNSTLSPFYQTQEPNNNPFGPNSTSFPPPSLFSQSQAFNTTNEPFKPNNNPFGTTNNNTSPTPNIFALNKHHQTQTFNLPGRRLEPNSATCGANDEVFQSISAMPGYEAKSHEEWRWENYKPLPNNKCCDFKNNATIRSPWSLLPNNNLLGPPSNNTTSSISSSVWPGESPFLQNATSPVQSFISPAPFTVEPYKPSNNNLFAPTNNNSTTPFPSPQFSSFPLNGPTNTFNQFPPASQPAGNTGIHFFTDSFSQPSQEASSSSTRATEVGYQNINGQQHQYVPESIWGTQSSIGLSSSPSKVPNKLSSNTRTVPPQQSPSSEPKVALSHDEVDRSGPFVLREIPNAWVANSLASLHSSSDGEVCEDRDLPTSFSFQLNIQEAEHLSVTSDSYEADVLSLMPKLPDGGEYYTLPSLKELAAKETAEPGSLGRVKDFVVGRFGNGSIKFLGETDVRDLDLGSVLQINNRKVIVYADAEMKPAVGKGMNKAAEVSLLNVKCVSKKTGKQYVDGPQVQSYKEMLIEKGSELGAEFVSYDPVQGEWKFRVQHF